MKSLFSHQSHTSVFLILSILIISPFRINAQQANVKVSENQDKKKMTLFFEKVYLHTDRSYYSSGDDIWFKAYLVNAISNIPLLETSNNLYVELISPEAKIIDRKLIRLDSSMGNGDFKLKDSIPGGTYKIRAYTNWMRNFGELFLFEKELHVYSIPGIKPANASLEKQKPTLQFFPEGGSLISETINNIAFKALNENGKGCGAKGFVISSKNDTVCLFNTSYMGMGTFSFMPIEGEKYFAVGTLDGTTQLKTNLPESLPRGFGLRIYDFDTASFFISIYTNQATYEENLNARLIINCMSHSKNYYTGYVTLNSTKNDIRMPKKYFPEGITSITLYDTLIRPHSQRLINIHKKESLQVTFSTNKTEYLPREAVSIDIKVKNLEGLPVKTQFSIAAVDNGQVPDDVSNIQSYLMLESEVKGKIEEPKNYFDTTNPMRHKQLDLLLLTQGWRDFIWRRIKDSVPIIKYMVEPGITFSGRVRQKFANNPIPNSSVTLYIPKAEKSKLFFTETNQQGNYYLHGIEFHGTQNVILTTSNAKGKNTGWILFDNPDTSRYPVTPFLSGSNDFLNKSKFASESNFRNTIKKKYTLSDTIQLAEVVISAAKQKEEKMIKNHLIETGSRPDHIFKITPEDYSYDFGSFLLMKVPRARLAEQSESSGAPLNRVMFNVSGDEQPPRFIVDGRTFQKGDLQDENFIYNLPMEGIEEIMVSYNDVFSGSTAVSFAAGVAISIVTNPNAFQKMNFYSISKYINGYYEARNFYSPVYPEPIGSASKPDLRTTLYWNPKLTTNEKGECKITFFNSDKNTTIKLSLEGITDNGMPIVNNTKYEIKK